MHVGLVDGPGLSSSRRWGGSPFGFFIVLLLVSENEITFTAPFGSGVFKNRRPVNFAVGVVDRVSQGVGGSKLASRSFNLMADGIGKFFGSVA